MLRTTWILTAAVVLASCHNPQMSPEDRAFNQSLSSALRERRPIDLVQLEHGDWSTVCAVGETRPSEKLPNQQARPGEGAFHDYFDGGSTVFGPGGALAFVYRDGVEVRPTSGLSPHMGLALDDCAPREEAILVWNDYHGWHFRSRTEAHP